MSPSPAFAIRERKRRMVFQHLPLLSADMSTRWEMNVHYAGALSASERDGCGRRFVPCNAARIAFEGHRRVIAVLSLESRTILEDQGA